MFCLKKSICVTAVCLSILPLPVLAGNAVESADGAPNVVQQSQVDSSTLAQPDAQGLVTAPAEENIQVQATPKLEKSASNKEMVANEIAEINQRIAVLSARYAEIEMQARISAKLAEMKRMTEDPEKKASEKSAKSNSGPPSDTLALLPRLEDTAVPSVKEISGVDGQLKAVLALKNGNIQTVKVGDKVSGWTVKNVQVDAVEIEKNGKTVVLPFGGLVATASVTPYKGMSAMPPIPPVSLESISSPRNLTQ